MSVLVAANPLQTEVPMVDGPGDEQVIQSVDFKGRPGVTATASIIRLDGESEPSLMITHQRPDDVRTYLVLDNAKLSLNAMGIEGSESTLEVSPGGSLLIKQQNQGIGRHRFERTLTVAYRGEKYVVAGFTYSYWDTLDPEASGSCDYNLLNGRGIKDNLPLHVKVNPLPLETLEDSEQLYKCTGW